MHSIFYNMTSYKYFINKVYDSVGQWLMTNLEK